ncbi:hypothetical protein EYF80_054495 [Liparis tanakae]|uniref:Uncharacterized protein n=1 Tax=Liparis tanakae TaxID=230148 RepID=A0A4Z2F398_9TELE|nr:hypothetical protein EYF80_054495 [Liparis tanakae]
MKRLAPPAAGQPAGAPEPPANELKEQLRRGPSGFRCATERNRLVLVDRSVARVSQGHRAELGPGWLSPDSVFHAGMRR